MTSYGSVFSEDGDFTIFPCTDKVAAKMEASKGNELVIQNVSFHRRGRVEHGDVHFTRHHMIFKYHPNKKPQTRDVSAKHSLGSSIDARQQYTSQSGSAISSSSELDKLGAEIKNGEKKAQATLDKERRHGRAKEIYVSYPLIHSCQLRPSHAPGAQIQRSKNESTINKIDELDNIFPPTLGTSYARSSTDSNPSSFSPQRPAFMSTTDLNGSSGLKPPIIRVKCRDFTQFALHFDGHTERNTADELARETFFALRNRRCVDIVLDLYAFHFAPPAEEVASYQRFDMRADFQRMGIGGTVLPGSAWRFSEINKDYSYSPTYPSVLVVPWTISDNILKYSGSFRSRSRIPALSYLHGNGGSITRSSQPMTGMTFQSNPQDEKLVQAIFSSHSTSYPAEDVDQENKTTSDLEENPVVVQKGEDEEFKKVYGSTRRNVIIDARPQMNARANRAKGGGYEDTNHYSNANSKPVELHFLNIANIHSMRQSLDKVVEALGNADYLDIAPNQELLKNSGWLKHISRIMDGAEETARVIGLSGSHALIHCSDGWDRTAQVSAVAQIMLDPHYRSIKGFITLVHKEFVSFGHKFEHRQGMKGLEKWFKIENEQIQPSRRDNAIDDGANNIREFGTRALNGAKQFWQGRTQAFRASTSSADLSNAGSPSSRPTTPPPNPVIHSAPSPVVKDKKQKLSEDEVSPVFHQFLDAVYQLLRQSPNSFEFNERFLRRLFYQSYAGQYGEFLFNCEQERAKYYGRYASVWGYFLARKAEFSNPDWKPDVPDTLLFPQRNRGELEIRWWNELFGRKDEEMNVPKALEPPSLAAQLSSVSLDENVQIEKAENVSIRAAKSTPAFNTYDAGLDGAARDVHSGAPSEHDLQAHASHESSVKQRHVGDSNIMDFEEVDPLGATQKRPLPSTGFKGGLDFAAFAQQNAFSDR